MRIAALTLVLLLPAALAWAEWRAETLDDGTWFQAAARSSKAEVEVACGGRSARQLSADQSRVASPILTNPGELQLSFRAKLFAGEPPPKQVKVRIDRLEYGLSEAHYDRPKGMFVLTVSADNPALNALTVARRFTVVPEDAGPIPLAGAETALSHMLDFCRERWATLRDITPESPERTKALAFAAAYAGGDIPEIRSLKLIDLNGDGAPEALMILGGKFCGARRCDGFVLDLQPEKPRAIGRWAVATIRPGITKLNGWLDLEVNGATMRYQGGEYAQR
ncbi:MAG: hypothetical protein AAF409_00185 [Pseudomonadota bacterium]